eukprot:CAMPEP_0116871024 /NCGR_PEP_ID=MMETSP0463-20121206/1200_1 /TAXON_ID=181622 /ORGANISM="Strombidinopsis sp, Strain SopsisLIS2011" /LENGTH=49 /DNA_ID=CAMNT_0004508683 /DNA_START=90 /DNA_END=239 /DNA_ORIENTATION=+
MDIQAKDMLPPFRASVMDGYAVKVAGNNLFKSDNCVLDVITHLKGLAGN